MDVENYACWCHLGLDPWIFLFVYNEKNPTKRNDISSISKNVSKQLQKNDISNISNNYKNNLSMKTTISAFVQLFISFNELMSSKNNYDTQVI